MFEAYSRKGQISPDRNHSSQNRRQPSQGSTSPGKRLLFSVNLELDGGRSDRINYFAKDSPEELAFSICRARGLNLKVYNMILATLREKLAEYQGNYGGASSQVEDGPRNVSKTPTRPEVVDKRPNAMVSNAFVFRPSQSNSTLHFQDKSVGEGWQTNMLTPPKSTLSSKMKKVQLTPSPTQNDKTNLSSLLQTDKGQYQPNPDQHRQMSSVPHGQGLSESPNASGNSKSMYRLTDKLMTPERANRELFTVEELFMQPTSQEKSKSAHKRRGLQNNSLLSHSQTKLRVGPTQKENYTAGMKRSGSVGKHAGSRLYNQGILSHSKKLAQMEHSINIRQQLELAGASFAPEINKISEMIFERKPDRSNLPCHERLSKQAQSSQANKERIRRLHKEVEENRYEFQPKINPISKIIDAEKDKTLNQTNLSRHDLLFEDSKVRLMASPLTEQKHKNMQGITFQPHINAQSKKMVDESFLSRLDASIEKKKALIKKSDEEKNVKPNRVLSRPQTRSKSPIQRSKKIGEMKSVYKYLYAMGMDHHHKLEALINEEIELAKGSTTKSNMTYQSKLILNQAVQRKILRIFELLDQSKTGNITFDLTDLETHSMTFIKEATSSSGGMGNKQSIDKTASVLPGLSSEEVNKLFEPFLQMLSFKRKSLDYSSFEYLFRKFIRVVSV